MPARTNFQLLRVFGIRVGVSAGWFLFLGLLIVLLASGAQSVVHASQSTTYMLAVLGALAYCASLILHELGHALVARRLGIPIAGIDLWFFGGLTHTGGEPQRPGDELKIALAGPAVTLLLVLLFGGAFELAAASGHFTDVITQQGITVSPLLAVLGWIAGINVILLAFNMLPAFPLDGGRVARALIWWRTGDRYRGTRLAGRSGQLLAVVLGVWGVLLLARGSTGALMWLMLAMILYQAASGAVVQGSVGQRIRGVKVADIMDPEPVTVPAATGLLDAEEQYFQRYRWPWFAVVDPAQRFLGVVRAERVQEEIAAGRPALAVDEVLDSDMRLRISAEEPLEELLHSEGLRRLGAMVAVDENGVLRGVVTLAQIQRALKLAAGA